VDAIWSQEGDPDGGDAARGLADRLPDAFPWQRSIDDGPDVGRRRQVCRSS
jgi:hypothetical protein